MRLPLAWRPLRVNRPCWRALLLQGRARTAAALVQRGVSQARDPESVQRLSRVLVQQPHRVEQPGAARALRPCRARTHAQAATRAGAALWRIAAGQCKLHVSQDNAGGALWCDTAMLCASQHIPKAVLGHAPAIVVSAGQASHRSNNCPTAETKRYGAPAVTMSFGTAGLAQLCCLLRASASACRPAQQRAVPCSSLAPAEGCPRFLDGADLHTRRPSTCRRAKRSPGKTRRLLARKAAVCCWPRRRLPWA